MPSVRGSVKAAQIHFKSYSQGNVRRSPFVSPLIGLLTDQSEGSMPIATDAAPWLDKLCPGQGLFQCVTVEQNTLELANAD